MKPPVFVGVDCTRTQALAAAIPAELITTPNLDDPVGWEWTFSEAIERFGHRLLDGPPFDNAVVCTWAADYRSQPLVDTGADEWLCSVERTLALWFTVLTSVTERCADGGAVAVVVERPPPIDSAGHATTSAVAEGLNVVGRSLALIHGERGVRVNTVTTAIGTVPTTLVGPTPPLPSYPGTVDREVAGAVRLMLSPDACGISGTVTHADGGRT